MTHHFIFRGVAVLCVSRRRGVFPIRFVFLSEALLSEEFGFE